MSPFILAVIIVIFVCVIAWLCFRDTDTKRRARSRTAYASSSGQFDESAEHALDAINAITEPTVDDNYLAGNIMEFHILQGGDGIRIEGRRHNPRQQIVDDIAGRYMNVLNLLRDEFTEPNTFDIQNEPRARIRVGGVFENVRPLRPINRIPVGAFGIHRAAPMFMVNHIEHFAEDVMDEIPEVLLWNLLDTTRFIKTNNTEEIAKNATAKSTNKLEFAKNFTKDIKTHTEDEQNVHDRSVNIGNKNTIQIIKASASSKTPDQVITEIRKHAESNPREFSAATIADLNLVLAEMKAGGMMSTYGESEPNILKYVWDRTFDKHNAANANAMRNMLVTNLSKCMSQITRMPVCATGRTSTAIGSLTTLDYDSEVGATLTEEQYCNEIRNSAVTILDKLVSEEKKSTSLLMAAVADSYDDPTIVTDAEFEKLFKRNLKSRIDKMVDSYSDKVTTQTLENMRAECYVAVTLD